MGDLRNKIRKQMEFEREMAWRDARQTPPEPPLACWCGMTIYQVPITAYKGPDRKTVLACPDHAPIVCNRCWDFATRQDGNEALCERCWERK